MKFFTEARLRNTTSILPNFLRTSMITPRPRMSMQLHVPTHTSEATLARVPVPASVDTASMKMHHICALVHQLIIR